MKVVGGVRIAACAGFIEDFTIATPVVDGSCV